MAFALALPLSRGKHSHVRELVYASGPNSRNSNQGANDDDVARGLAAEDQKIDEAGLDANQPMSMHVKLNFDSGVSLIRSYSVKDRTSEQSIIEANGVETPLTMDEYKAKITKMKLDIGEFCFY